MTFKERIMILIAIIILATKLLMLMGEESDYQEDDTKIVIDPKPY